MIAAIGVAQQVAVLPFYATLEDEDRPGRMREEWTPDGNHPSVAGHRRLGEIAFALQPFRKPKIAHVWFVGGIKQDISWL